MDFSRNEIGALDVSSSATFPLLTTARLSGNLLESFSAATLVAVCPAIRLIDVANNIIGEASIGGIGENVEAMYGFFFYAKYPIFLTIFFFTDY